MRRFCECGNILGKIFSFLLAVILCVPSAYAAPGGSAVGNEPTSSPIMEVGEWSSEMQPDSSSELFLDDSSPSDEFDYHSEFDNFYMDDEEEESDEEDTQSDEEQMIYYYADWFKVDVTADIPSRRINLAHGFVEEGPFYDQHTFYSLDYSTIRDAAPGTVFQYLHIFCEDQSGEYVYSKPVLPPEYMEVMSNYNDCYLMVAYQGDFHNIMAYNTWARIFVINPGYDFHHDIYIYAVSQADPSLWDRFGENGSIDFGWANWDIEFGLGQITGEQELYFHNYYYSSVSSAIRMWPRLPTTIYVNHIDSLPYDVMDQLICHGKTDSSVELLFDASAPSPSFNAAFQDVYYPDGGDFVLQTISYADLHRTTPGTIIGQYRITDSLGATRNIAFSKPILPEKLTQILQKRGETWLLIIDDGAVLYKGLAIFHGQTDYAINFCVRPYEYLGWRWSVTSSPEPNWTIIVIDSYWYEDINTGQWSCEPTQYSIDDITAYYMPIPDEMLEEIAKIYKLNESNSQEAASSATSKLSRANYEAKIIANAQALLTETNPEQYTTMYGYINHIKNKQLYYSRTLNDSDYYHLGYNFTMEWGARFIDLLCDLIPATNVAELGMAVNSAYISVLADEIQGELMGLTPRELVFSLAKSGINGIQTSALFDIDDRMVDGRFVNYEDALMFIRIHQMNEACLAAGQMGYALYMEELQRGPLNHLSSLISDLAITKLGGAFIRSVGLDAFLEYTADALWKTADGWFSDTLSFFTNCADIDCVRKWKSDLERIENDTKRLLLADGADPQSNSWSAIYQSYVIGGGYKEYYRSGGQDWEDPYYVDKFGLWYCPQNEVYTPIWFALYDMDRNAIPELLAYNGYGDSGLGAVYAFTIENGKMKYIDNIGPRLGLIFSYTDDQYTGLFDETWHGGYHNIGYSYLYNGELENIFVASYTAMVDEYGDPSEMEILEERTNDEALWNLFINGTRKGVAGYTVQEIEQMSWEAFAENMIV